MTAKAESRPNILLLFSDQHNKSVLGFEGHPDVITPNLDRLASESVVFERAYCTVGISAPSRMSMMSGLYPRTLGMMSNDGRTSVTEQDAVSLATVLQQNGYDTFAFGKRHLDGAVDQGWTVRKDHLYRDDEENYVDWITEQGYIKEFAMDWAAEFGKGPQGSEEFKKRYPTADLGTRTSCIPEDCTMEAWTARNTIEMIRSRKDSDKPFFCWASFYRPHQPYNPQPRYLSWYRFDRWGEGTAAGDAIRRPDNFYHPTELLPPALQAQRNGHNKVWNMDKAFADEQIWRNYIAGYYALVSEIDYWIGEIIAALEEAGLEEETIIIYTADHGDFAGRHGMVEKCAVGHNVYEDILNVPFIVKYPGNRYNGTKNYEIVSLIDIFPTLVELLDLDLPRMKYPLQGEDLSRVLLKGASVKRDYFVSESWSQAAVITETCKLGLWKDPEIDPKIDFRSFGDQFFDYETNPLEVENDYAKPENRKRIERLEKMYRNFVKSIPDVGYKERIAACENR